MRAKPARCFLIGHAGHPEVEGTIGQFDTSFGGSIYLVADGEDVAHLKVRNADHLAFVTQTTLSVDDTADIVAALRALSGAQGAGERGHLLRHAKSPGRRQGPDRALRSAGGGRFEEQLQFEPVARNGRQERQAGISGGRSRGSETRVVRRHQTVGVTAGASAPEILVQGVIAQLRKWGGEVAKSCRGARNT
jgi:4-hydroxy-3-methylbut-2-enyl diphosphate reductase